MATVQSASLPLAPSANAKRSRPTGLSAALPALALIVAFFVLPVLALLMRSVLEPVPGLENYAEMLDKLTSGQVRIAASFKNIDAQKQESHWLVKFENVAAASLHGPLYVTIENLKPPTALRSADRRPGQTAAGAAKAPT